MPDQFSVHRNPGRNTRAIPLVVVVQSNRFRASTRRVIVPLLDAAEFGLPDSEIGPHFEINGRKVVLDPRQITNVPRDALNESLGSLLAEDTRIINALDAMLSCAWR